MQLVRRAWQRSNMPVRKIFLSSTTRDVHEYRKAAHRAINRLEDYKCIWMEDFGARDWEADEFCRQNVAGCDIFAGIVGHCYGSCPKGSDKSYAEREYDAAVAAEKPRLMFFAPEDFPVPANRIESSRKRNKQLAFRKRIGEERIYATFASPELLAEQVVLAIYNWEKDHLWQAWLQKTATTAKQQEIARIRSEIHDRVFGALLLLAEGADDALQAGDKGMRVMLTDVRPRVMRMYNALALVVGITTKEDEAIEIEQRTQRFIHELEDICGYYEKGIKLKIHRNFHPDVVKLIPTRFFDILARVLETLLQNVWDHADATEVQVTLEPDRPPRGRKRPRLIKLTISDNGKGCDFSWDSLDPDQQLGLTNAREIIEKLGGKLEVHSALGEGCTVMVIIPLRSKNAGGPPKNTKN